MTVRSVVVLPAPLRPTRQTSSPAATLKLTTAKDFAALNIDGKIGDFQHGVTASRLRSP